MGLKLYLQMCNRLLDDNDRELLNPIVETLAQSNPEMMSRKIPRANVQQAFGALAVIENMNDKPPLNILGVGIYEDTCYDYVMKTVSKGSYHNLFGIDPYTDMDLHTLRTSLHPDYKYDIIFSISVMEHVKNDLEFLNDICDLLSNNGIAILTVDFLNGYDGKNKPHFAERFYTKEDLKDRIIPFLNEKSCYTVNVPDWEGEPDFEYQGFKYNLATLVFTKVGMDMSHV